MNYIEVKLSREFFSGNSSDYEGNRDKAFHILLGVTICVILAVMAFIFFYIVSKRQHNRELAARQTSLNEGTMKEKQTPL